MNTIGETQQTPAPEHQAPALAARPHGTPWAGIAVIAAAAFAAEMAVSARYGYVRDTSCRPGVTWRSATSTSHR